MGLRATAAALLLGLGSHVFALEGLIEGKVTDNEGRTLQGPGVAGGEPGRAASDQYGRYPVEVPTPGAFSAVETRAGRQTVPESNAPEPTAVINRVAEWMTAPSFPWPDSITSTPGCQLGGLPWPVISLDNCQLGTGDSRPIGRVASLDAPAAMAGLAFVPRLPARRWGLRRLLRQSRFYPLYGPSETVQRERQVLQLGAHMPERADTSQETVPDG